MAGAGGDVVSVERDCVECGRRCIPNDGKWCGDGRCDECAAAAMKRWGAYMVRCSEARKAMRDGAGS